jgi:hypothetical protein
VTGYHYISLLSFISFISLKRQNITHRNLISSFQLSTVRMVVPLSSIVKQNPQYLAQFLIKPSCLLLWHCINLAPLRQGKINVHDKLEGVRKTKEISFRILDLQPRFKLHSSEMLEMLPLCKHSVITYNCTPLLSYTCWHSLNFIRILPISIKLKHICHAQFHAF